MCFVAKLKSIIFHQNDGRFIYLLIDLLASLNLPKGFRPYFSSKIPSNHVSIDPDSILDNNRTYSTTFNTQVKNTNNNGHFKEESFLIKADSNTNSFRIDKFKSETDNMMDELSKNKLFNMNRDRSKSRSKSRSPEAPRRTFRDTRSKSKSPEVLRKSSLFSKERTPSPPIRRERSKTPDR